MNLQGEGQIKRLTNSVLIKNKLWRHVWHLGVSACHRSEACCTADSRASTNIQLKPKTGPNQVHVYLQDQIQQSAALSVGKHVVKNVPWTRETLLFFLFPPSFFKSCCFVRQFLRPTSVSQRTGAPGWALQKIRREVEDLTMRCASVCWSLMSLKTQFFTAGVTGWRPVCWALFHPLRLCFWEMLNHC